jgi:hypothetical protein
MDSTAVSQLFLQLGVAAVFAFAWLREREYSQKLTDKILTLLEARISKVAEQTPDKP